MLPVSLVCLVLPSLRNYINAEGRRKVNGLAY